MPILADRGGNRSGRGVLSLGLELSAPWTERKFQAPRENNSSLSLHAEHGAALEPSPRSRLPDSYIRGEGVSEDRVLPVVMAWPSHLLGCLLELPTELVHVTATGPLVPLFIRNLLKYSKNDYFYWWCKGRWKQLGVCTAAGEISACGVIWSKNFIESSLRTCLY